MPSAQLIETPTDFRDAMSGMSFQYHTLLKPSVAIEPDFRRAVDDIFSDLPYISRDDPELVEAYLNGIEEPLRCLSKLGFIILAVTTRGVWKTADGKEFPNWTNTRYFIMPKGAYFALDDDLNHPVHCLDPACEAFIRDLMSACTGSLPYFISVSKEAISTAYEGNVPWCTNCCLSEVG
jgi:hypothetical protein